MKLLAVIILISVALAVTTASAQQYELVNNFLQNLSFITGTDRGMEQNLDDNFGWMQQQGYTHLRFFGILPNGYYFFPSPTLESHGFPTHPYFTSVLELLVTKANEYGIVVNFDGWEVIAESNYDTTVLGVGFITAEELAAVVQDVLSLGVNLITEEQFGSGYIQAIQAATASQGAEHETTTVLWWQNDTAYLIADQQLGNAFSFYPFDQAEVDSVIGAGFHHSYPANLGLLHIVIQSAKRFNVPTSIAVGSFGTLEPENWKNILLFAQLVHPPDRFSIEESETEMLIWDADFNFMEYVGNDLQSLTDHSLTGQPVANLIYDLSSLYNDSFYPAWLASLMNASAIVNTFTSLGYKVVATIDSVLTEADAYYLLPAGGPGYPNAAALPDYVMPLMQGTKPVFIQPAFGIPDNTDEASWIPFREYFGLSATETQTLGNSIPQSVVYEGDTVYWGGIELYLTPVIERIAVTDIDAGLADVVLSGEIEAEDIALIVARGNKFLINSNLIHLDAFYVLSSLLGGPLNKSSMADIVITEDKGIIFAEHDTDLDIDLPWYGTARLMRRDPAGNLIVDEEVEISGNFASTPSQGELIIILKTSDWLCGDANGDEQVNVGDAVYLISYVFKGGTGPDPVCLGDANGDSDANVGDAVYLISHIFKGGPAPVENCCH